MTLKFEPLSDIHNRGDFSCGEEALNLYLHQFASQDMRRELARTFIIRKAGNNIVFGYYTLCSGGIPVVELPDKLKKKLPKFPIPIVRLARLAVDKQQQSKGYGELLFMDSLYRASLAGESMGIFGMVIDAKHEKAKLFYEQYGFESLSNNPLLLFASLKNLKQRFLNE